MLSWWSKIVLEKSHVALFQKSEVGAGPYSLFLQQLLNGCGNNTERNSHSLNICGGGHFSVSVCVPPSLAHFVRLIYVGKTNKYELRFLSSTGKEKAFSFDGTFRTRSFWTHSIGKKFSIKPLKMYLLVALGPCCCVQV